MHVFPTFESPKTKTLYVAAKSRAMIFFSVVKNFFCYFCKSKNEYTKMFENEMRNIVFSIYAYRMSHQ